MNMIKCALQISKGAGQRGRTEGAVLPVGPPLTCLIRNFRVTQTARLFNHPSFRTRTGLKQALSQDRLKRATVQTHHYSRICFFFHLALKSGSYIKWNLIKKLLPIL